MSDASGQRCGNCRYASGKVCVENDGMDCYAPLPYCIPKYIDRNMVMPDDGKDCPTWHAK